MSDLYFSDGKIMLGSLEVAQLEKEEEGKLKIDIAPSSEREAGLNLQKKESCDNTL